MLDLHNRQDTMGHLTAFTVPILCGLHLSDLSLSRIPVDQACGLDQRDATVKDLAMLERKPCRSIAGNFSYAAGCR